MAKSLEQHFFGLVISLLLVITCLLVIVLYLINAAPLMYITCAIFVSPIGIYCLKFGKYLLEPFYQLSAMVESIRLEDYSLRVKPSYKTGIVNTLVQEVDLLADIMQARKTQYDQHVFLIYQLIAQLDTPIAVFDQHGLLSHGNDAFSNWCQTPWQTLKSTRSDKLGLTLNSKKWQFVDPKYHEKWQLRQSKLIMQGAVHHLLVLTDVEQLIKKTRQASWQQIIRVMSHEINNSLSPIKSLAQSLQEIPHTLDNQDDSRQALSVIETRSDALLQFVNRYAQIHQPLTIERTFFSIEALLHKVSALFQQAEFKFEIIQVSFNADQLLLEQVLINLIKNAIEACVDRKPLIYIRVATNDYAQRISICDNGCGVNNPENLFVPFYTTKENGKGIGLSLCNNIIEQHGGRLTLTNRLDAEGAEAEIRL